MTYVSKPTTYSAGTVVSSPWLNWINQKAGECVSVKDFGAVGDGVTDDTAAINAAIAASGSIYFPPGQYKVTSVITVTKSISLYGAGPNASYIVSTSTTLDVFHIKCATTGQWDYLSNVVIKDLGFVRNVAATSGSTLKLTQISGAVLQNVMILGGFNGLHIQGSQLGKFSNVSVLANTVSRVAGSSCILLEEASTTGGTYQPVFTLLFSNINVSAGGKADYGVKITSADGVTFNTGYMNNAYVSTVLLAATSAGQYISPLTFSNIYFDSTTGVPNGLRYASTTGAGYVKLDTCFFNGNTEEAVYIAAPAAALNFYIQNTHIGYTPSWGVYVAGGGVAYTKVIVDSCRFMQVGTGASKGGLYATNCELVKITDSYFTNISGASSSAVSLAGTIGTYQSVGNLHSGNTSDYTSSATITTPLYGGSSNDSGTFSNNVSVAFGGASVGVTYSSRVATWSRVGRHIVFSIYISLSSKGSSVGNMTIEGLPFTSNSLNVSACAVNLYGSAGVGDTSLSATVANNATNVALYKTAATGLPTQLTDADIRNVSFMTISGSYYI